MEEGDIHQPKHGWQHLASGAQTLHCVHQGWRGSSRGRGGEGVLQAGEVGYAREEGGGGKGFFKIGGSSKGFGSTKVSGIDKVQSLGLFGPIWTTIPEFEPAFMVTPVQIVATIQQFGPSGGHSLTFPRPIQTVPPPALLWHNPLQHFDPKRHLAISSRRSRN